MTVPQQKPSDLDKLIENFDKINSEAEELDKDLNELQRKIRIVHSSSKINQLMSNEHDSN